MNKQHLLMVDDLGMALLKQLVPGMMFVPVVGMDINDQPAFKLLAVPFEPLVVPMDTEMVPAVESLVEPLTPEPCLPVPSAEEPIAHT